VHCCDGRAPSAPRRWNATIPLWGGVYVQEEFSLSAGFQSAVGEIRASGAISAWLYDRRGYNLEKSASFFANY